MTGAEAGDSYELPLLGRMSFENSLANPASGVKTVVMSTDDSTPGEVYLYVGTKQATGTAVEKAGLTNGLLFGIAAEFGDDTVSTPPDVTPPAGFKPIFDYPVVNDYRSFLVNERELVALRKRFEGYTGPVVNAGGVR